MPYSLGGLPVLLPSHVSPSHSLRCLNPDCAEMTAKFDLTVVVRIRNPTVYGDGRRR